MKRCRLTLARWGRWGQQAGRGIAGVRGPAGAHTAPVSCWFDVTEPAEILDRPRKGKAWKRSKPPPPKEKQLATIQRNLSQRVSAGLTVPHHETDGLDSRFRGVLKSVSTHDTWIVSMSEPDGPGATFQSRPSPVASQCAHREPSSAAARFSYSADSSAVRVSLHRPLTPLLMNVCAPASQNAPPAATRTNSAGGSRPSAIRRLEFRGTRRCLESRLPGRVLDL